MYEIDGICYAGMATSDEAEILEAVACEGRVLLCTFSNGQRRLFDTTILTGSAFDLLDDPQVFNNVVVDYGTVTWADGSIDIAPEYVYEHSLPYNTDDVVSVA